MDEGEDEEVEPEREEEEIIDMGPVIGSVVEESTHQPLLLLQEEEPEQHDVGMSTRMVLDHFNELHVPFVFYETGTTIVSGYKEGYCSPLFAMIMSMMGTLAHDFRRLFQMTKDHLPAVNVIKHLPPDDFVFNEDDAVSIIEDCCRKRDRQRNPFVCMYQHPRTWKINAWWSGRNSNTYDPIAHMYYLFAKTLDLERAILLATEAENDMSMFGFIHPLSSAKCQLQKIVLQ